MIPVVFGRDVFEDGSFTVFGIRRSRCGKSLFTGSFFGICQFLLGLRVFNESVLGQYLRENRLIYTGSLDI